jgi:hypothetical protein
VFLLQFNQRVFVAQLPLWGHSRILQPSSGYILAEKVKRANAIVKPVSDGIEEAGIKHYLVSDQDSTDMRRAEPLDEMFFAALQE